MIGHGHIRRRRQRRQRHRGVTLLYTGLIIVALMGIVSLAVDLGRVQLAKAELHVAADAAARYAAPGIADGTTLSRAQDAAADNKVNGTPVVLLAEDVSVGRWDAAARAFTAGATPANAVRVVAQRTTARGNAVPLLFGPVVGVNTSNVSATAIVTFKPTTLPYGIVGVSSVEINGNVTIDSYDSSVANYSQSWSPDRGHVVSNGEIDLIGSVEVRGDVTPGPGEGAATGGTVTGSREPLQSDLSVPPVSSGPYGPTYNDNANIPSAYRPGEDFVFGGTSLTIPAGTYYFRHFNLDGNAILNVSGDVTIYITGNLSMHGGTGAHRPQQLRFRGIGPGEFDLEGNQDIYAVIEAPTKDVTIGGNKQLFGSVIGNTVRVYGSTEIHYDESLSAAVGSGGGTVGTITQVR